MRKFAFGLVALGYLITFAVAANSQAPSTVPVLKGENGRVALGDAPKPPVLKKAPPAPVIDETPKQPEQPEISEGDIVRVSTSLISVPAQVMDRSGRYIGNLRREDFVLYENGIQQELSYFGSIDQPFTVALLLDSTLR